MAKVSNKKRCDNPKDILKRDLSELFSQYSTGDFRLPEDIPTKWEKHGDLILLPPHSFKDPVWNNFGDSLWDTVATALKCKRIARKNRVLNDEFRSPNVELLKGNDSWVVHVDNKIKYTYDVMKCMFSSGNITEKLRIAQFSCEGETIVDLYAGIGYFTLPFLVHAKASFVHACEWNPNAVEALQKNLVLNGVEEKCMIHFGDNREVCPKNIADRVNLGLIPSSEAGWRTACQALKQEGGILHIHGNVTSYAQSNLVNDYKKPHHPEWDTWSQEVSSSIKSILSSLHQNEWNVNILEITRIKSYAPHIDHLVLDLKCQPILIK